MVGIPDELKQVNGRIEFSTTIHYEKQNSDLALCTYTTKTKSRGMKNVFMLATMKPILGITKDDQKCKPNSMTSLKVVPTL